MTQSARDDTSGPTPLAEGLRNAVGHGRTAEAVSLLRRAIAEQPADARLHGRLGQLLARCGDPHGAAASYRQAIACGADDPAAQVGLGNALMGLDRPEEAAAAYRAALTIAPDHADAACNLGTALHRLGDLDGAASAYRKALAAAPRSLTAHYNLAIALADLGLYGHAAAHYRQALALTGPDCSPDGATILNNLGNALKNRGDIDGAIGAFRRARELKPGYALAAYNEGLALLLAGDYRRGLPLYEARWRCSAVSALPPATVLPQWTGQPPGADARLLVLHEQGLGDAIMMARYLPPAAGVFAGVTCLVAPTLARLFRHSLGATVAIVTDRRDAPDGGFTHHCPMMSLPLAFATDPACIPACDGVLSADGAATAEWRARTPSADRLRVGIAWAGRRDNAMDRFRSLPLAALRGLLTMGGPAWFSLQKDAPMGEIAGCGLSGVLHDPMPDCRDIFDTAALIATLDLVISADTAVAHLAGALGRPVWLLNRAQSEWRWMRGRSDSPWYPTMRILTQQAPGDWGPVLDEAAARLRLMLAGRRVRYSAAAAAAASREKPSRV